MIIARLALELRCYLPEQPERALQHHLSEVEQDYGQCLELQERGFALAVDPDEWLQFERCIPVSPECNG